MWWPFCTSITTHPTALTPPLQRGGAHRGRWPWAAQGIHPDCEAEGHEAKEDVGAAQVAKALGEFCARQHAPLEGGRRVGLAATCGEQAAEGGEAGGGVPGLDDEEVGEALRAGPGGGVRLGVGIGVEVRVGGQPCPSAHLLWDRVCSVWVCGFRASCCTQIYVGGMIGGKLCTIQMCDQTK